MIIDTFFDLIRPFQFRGKIRVLRPIVPGEGHKTTSVFGYRMDLDLGNYIDRMIYLGCYEPMNTHRFKSVLSSGMTVVDVGANIGYFTLLASRLVGSEGKVIAIEPHPTNFSALAETVRRNSLKHVRLERLGLSDHDGEAGILMPDQVEFPLRTAMIVATDTVHALPVRIRRLDDCIREWGLSSIDLLKIDVDGDESNILEGSRESLKAGIVKNLVIELNDYWLKQGRTSSAAVARSILEFGFDDRSNLRGLAATVLGPTTDRHFVLRAPSPSRRQIASA